MQHSRATWFMASRTWITQGSDRGCSGVMSASLRLTKPSLFVSSCLNLANKSAPSGRQNVTLPRFLFNSSIDINLSLLVSRAVNFIRAFRSVSTLTGKELSSVAFLGQPSLQCSPSLAQTVLHCSKQLSSVQ